MNVLSLFAGIGGLDLGLERAGMTVVGQVEIDPFCRRVLAKHWPEVPRHDDVRTTISWWDGAARPRVDVVCGGFPCQPVSQAGKRRAQKDERWLWPEMLAIVADLRPEWVIWENVPGLLTHGLDIVHRDITGLGYRHRVGWATACAVDAPHMRKRLFGMAHAPRQRRPTGWAEPIGEVIQDPPRIRVEPSGDGRWADEPDVDRVAYGVPGRVDRCRALGNAVVPQVAEHLGRLIVTADDRAAAVLAEDLAARLTLVPGGGRRVVEQRGVAS
jgi:DNA (cytosine-5)-methyltransferase 1